ncbi:ser/thr kinase stk11 (lkb1)-like protein [Dinothrombium tinctorium]|uniref:Ser/thr kinase stk11 (Lkb1)-like protein n=1 Tax=Dinothrombium tinctorium TaxID=1965070 RepID=A0A3S3NML5_9ACAR|nr:ser/thr kinase stk11 (lkb1)-like protein [Dinothrombium tinctorium]
MFRTRENKEQTENVIDQNSAPTINVLNFDWKFERRKNPEFVAGKYLKGNILGDGTWGEVIEVLDINTLNRLAMKRLRVSRIHKHPNHKEILRMAKVEMKILTKLCHRNIVKVFDYSHEDIYCSNNIYLIMEYCASSVDELMQVAEDGKLPFYQSHKYFVELINGLEYLHSFGIVHKDIKPENMLIGNDDTMKLTDFGVCELLDIFEKDLCTQRYGTIIFQPPELFILEEDIKFSGFKSDVWSAGVTLYNMISGKFPFKPSLVGTYVMKDDFSLTPDIEQDCLLADLFTKLFIKDPDQRITIAGIKRHAWFSLQFYKEKVEIPIRGKHGDKYRSLTMTPYLHQLHFPLKPEENEVIVPDEESETFENKSNIPILRANRSPKSRKKPIDARLNKILGRPMSEKKKTDH